MYLQCNHYGLTSDVHTHTHTFSCVQRRIAIKIAYYSVYFFFCCCCCCGCRLVRFTQNDDDNNELPSPVYAVIYLFFFFILLNGLAQSVWSVMFAHAQNIIAPSDSFDITVCRCCCCCCCQHHCMIMTLTSRARHNSLNRQLQLRSSTSSDSSLTHSVHSVKHFGVGWTCGFRALSLSLFAIANLIYEIRNVVHIHSYSPRRNREGRYLLWLFIN